MGNLFSILINNPIFYNLSQVILAPGAKKGIVREIKRILKLMPPSENILDVGCGPKS